MRVLSYNVRVLRDDRAAVTRVIRACLPDVVCVQEAPRFLRWRGLRAGLAADSGLLLAGGGRVGGLAVLCAYGVEVVATEHHELTPVPGLHRRALSIAVVETGGRRYVVGCTHLDLRADARLEHAEEILALLAAARGAYGGPVVLAGDLNEGPDGAAWRRIAERYPDTCPGGGPTFRSDRPDRRIDAVFAEHGLTVRTAGVPTEPDPADLAIATDHLPVLADLA